ncbi:hypothetical protein Scep_001817 [Stephania cephalantha]|uniref:Uncharacterized protein n=1 Tax=Stephania cephalantha TaxID=152367 RepID=A0AAP0L8Y4_9MAGN
MVVLFWGGAKNPIVRLLDNGNLVVVESESQNLMTLMGISGELRLPIRHFVGWDEDGLGFGNWAQSKAHFLEELE